MKRFLTDGRWRRRLGRSGGVAVISLAAIGTLWVTALAGGAGASSKHAAIQTRLAPALRRAAVASNGPDAVRAYWTKARMDSAKPAGGIAGTRSSSAATSAGNTATGNPGTAGGFVPAGLGSVAGPASPPNSSPTSISPADGSFPGPNDTFDWYPKFRVYPVSTIGKLFFTEPSGNFVCSAAATYGGGTTDMVWTAGHCVGPQGGQSYYSNFLFCPSYNNGENPKVGCWSWAQAQQTGGWYFNGYWEDDYAYLYMQNCGDIICNDVVNVTGGLGFAWNWSRDQHWMDFGYPSGSPYDGGAIVVTAAEHRYDVNNGQADGASDNSIGSAQTPGFSGGPWILSFGNNSAAPTDPISHGDWINSNNSYYFTSGPNGNEYGKEIQGPYYDTNACNFWKGGSGWTGTC